MSVYADKKNGQLTGRWRVDLKKGKETYRQRHDTFEAAKADEERAKAIWAAGGSPSGTPSPVQAPKAHTVAEVAAEARGALWVGSTTEETCWAHVRIVGEIIGNKPLDEIETPDLTRVFRELTKRGKKPGTINRHFSHFRTFMIWAKANKYRTVAVNKNDDLKFPWQKESAGRIRWFTPEEEAGLQKHLPRNVWMLVKVAIETGCRRDELLFAKPDQINGNLLHIWKTKTHNARTVPMTDETTAMLTELVTTGIMPSKRGLRSWWDRAAKKMGLEDDPQFTFHVARHTCATRLVDAGINLLVIQEWMGHKRIETTQRYAHVKPGNLIDALIRRGTAGADSTQKSPRTADNDAPPPSPTGGVNGLETGREAA